MSETFRAIPITDRVFWVGAVDWDIRSFHGYATSRGTTYNAFLVKGETPILIDTVKKPFLSEMMARIRSVLPEGDVPVIISNHAEMDHSGAIPEAAALLNTKTVYASRAGCRALRAHFPQLDILQQVPIDAATTIGDASFVFHETRMLHWPDSMVSYLCGDRILFTQDAFGMHMATLALEASAHERSVLRAEAAKYYGNILTPYSKLVAALLNALPGLGLDIDIVAPDHGPIWRGAEEIGWIIGLWKQWSTLTPTDKVVVVYDTMWNSTALMARAVADGVVSGGSPIFMAPLSAVHRSDVATELLEAGALLVGTPTINQEMFPSVADVLCYLKGIKRHGLIGQGFGSHGWSGEGVERVRAILAEMSVEPIGTPVTATYVPDAQILSACRELGVETARQLASRRSS